ncbi:hypothetical protein B0H14DRAFT_3457464 [Mycena olivaceomarginata]|nr:hypothetical protein B0H14DRAFT_3457464 [Mycena olivaceomarginata]
MLHIALHSSSKLEYFRINKQEKRARPRTLISTVLHLPRLSAIPRTGYSHPSPIVTAISVTPGPGYTTYSVSSAMSSLSSHPRHPGI